MNTYIPLCFVLSMLLISCRMNADSSSFHIESTPLPEYMAEGGTPSREEVHFSRQWLDAVLNSDQDNHDRSDAFVDEGLPFSFRYAGQSSDDLLCRWKTSRKRIGNKLLVTWQDPGIGLKLTWTITQIPNHPALEWILSFENTGSEDTNLIEDVQALRISLNRIESGKPFTIYGANGGRSLRDDLMPFTIDLPSGGANELMLGTTGANPDPWFYAFHSSNNHLPFFNISSPDNRGVAVGVGWSGQWLAGLKTSGNTLTAKVGLKHTSFILHPGEKVRSPKILLVFWNGKPLHGQNMLRRVLYDHYIPHIDGKPQRPLVSVNTCFTYHGHGAFLYCGEKELTPLVEPFAELGVESFVIDAGWWDCPDNFNINIGTYKPSLDRYPKGLKPLSDRLAKHSIRMGLWMPVETIDPNSTFARENPNLVADNHWELGPWRLKMESPDTRAWILSQIDDLIKHQGLGCYRQDFYTAYPPEPDCRKGMMEMQHLDGLYTVQDEIRRRYPKMLMEGCAGGGRRIDLETLSRFDWHQKSDRWFDSVSDQCGLYGASMFLPGGVINVPTSATDDFGMWSSFAGQLCLAWHPLDSDFPMVQAKQQVELYKRIRPLLSGDFYPLTPCSLEAKWLAYQLHRTDLNKGFALVFKRKDDDSGTDSLQITLKGLNPALDYRLHLQHLNKELHISGADAAKGLTIPVTATPGAELIIYEAELPASED